MTPGILNCRVERGESLNENFAFNVAASGPSSNLGQELEGFFPSAKIRMMQTEVGVDNSDECDVGKVQPFGNHLGPDQNINLTNAEVTEDAPVILLPFQGIRIHPSHAGIGE